jgi:uncharacterized protein (TIGR02594 family)
MTNNFEKCKLIQEELATHDLYQDEINGVWNANTQIAFNKYVRAKKEATIIDLNHYELLWDNEKTPWMSFAWKECKKILTSEDVRKYYHATVTSHTYDLIPWNSAFLCWCIESVVKDKSPKSCGAYDWYSWADLVHEPFMGCIVLIADGKRPQRARVGFFVYLNEKTKQVYVLGANATDKINIAAYPLQRIICYRHLDMQAIKDKE